VSVASFLKFAAEIGGLILLKSWPLDRMNIFNCDIGFYNFGQSRQSHDDRRHLVLVRSIVSTSQKNVVLISTLLKSGLLHLAS
jgi:hypothetical protein